jgi:hypothetical protein
VGGQLYAQPLYPRGNSSRYPLDRTLSGSESRSRCDDEEKNSFTLAGIEPRSYSKIHHGFLVRHFTRIGGSALKWVATAWLPVIFSLALIFQVVSCEKDTKRHIFLIQSTYSS